MAVIETALWENQKEHQEIQNCHVELEEAIWNALHAYEYGIKSLNLKIVKNPRLLQEKLMDQTYILQ